MYTGWCRKPTRGCQHDSLKRLRWSGTSGLLDRRPRGRALRYGKAGHKWLAWFTDLDRSGVSIDRPALNDARDLAVENRAAIVVFDIARYSRSVAEGLGRYEQTPPVGGNHAGVWQNCGFYSEPIVAEQGVHSMEHGAAWITYRSDLPADQVDRLRSLAEGESFVLVSAWDSGLPTPVVASAWGRQLEATSASGPRLEEFVRAFQVGPNTPEPGAPCTAGVGDPG